MAINFFLGKHKLRMYILHLKAYLLGFEKIDEEKFTSVEESEIGRWFHSQILDKDIQYINITKLAKEVENLHIYGRKLLEFISQNNKEEALTTYDELEKKSKELLALFDEVESKVLNNY